MVAAAAQKLKESEITEQDSLLLVIIIIFTLFIFGEQDDVTYDEYDVMLRLDDFVLVTVSHVIFAAQQTRNLLRIAIFNISYIRGLFPEKYFNDKNVPALEMKIKKLMPMDAESRRLIDWMEKGVYDALQKKYLKTLMFCVCETADGAMIEEYAFAFSYSNSDSQEVSMNFNRIGSKKQGEFKFATTEITPAQMKSSACKMVRTLIQLMRTLDKMPEERTILMKLLYYDDVTPADYEPPFFRGCTEDETVNTWTKNPLKMEVGNVNSKHFVLALKVKSVLDPCEDDNVSLGGDSMQLDGDSESDSEASISDDEYIVAARDNQKGEQDGTMVDEDDTQDPAEDEQQLNRVRDWIKSYHLDDVDVADALSAFPDISLALIEEIMDKLVNEGLLLKAGNNSFNIKRARNLEYEFDAVKDENDGNCAPAKRSPLTTGEGLMYMKALYHALPMEYITISKLQSKLGGEANQNTVRKLMDKMTKEGYIEATNNRKLGKRVVQSDLTKKKLAEVQKVLNMDAMEDANETLNKRNVLENQTGAARHETSTFGAVHSIGSDLTRTKDKSDLQQNVSNSSVPILSKLREKRQKTPTSNNQPIASIESYAAGDEKGRNGVNQDDKMDTVVCSGQSTLSKRSRKASTVKDPILQYNMKRQKVNEM
ncbi:meiosis-specific protein ASY1 [Tanacetum coccineum]